jgi:hypothetical protein
MFGNIMMNELVTYAIQAADVVWIDNQTHI